ncbi:MAG TPA: hypothetical protein PK777_14580, partial [Thermoguttaceae bacterium]|nr:hypothetical protein [Thermoguttaceae bacterium]
MKCWARTVAGILVGGFLSTTGGLDLYAQGPVQGPWLNEPSAGQSTTEGGWRAKRSPSGAIPVQATVGVPWPTSARQAGSSSAAQPSSAAPSGLPSSAPPGFWSPAGVASPVARMAQQPSPTPAPSGAVPEPTPTPSNP